MSISKFFQQFTYTSPAEKT